MSSIAEGPTRKALADMDPEELHRWLVKRRKLLTDHKRFVQRYLHRRQRQRGQQKQTYTDRQYTQFQRLAEDQQHCSGRSRSLRIETTEEDQTQREHQSRIESSTRRERY